MTENNEVLKFYKHTNLRGNSPVIREQALKILDVLKYTNLATINLRGESKAEGKIYVVNQTFWKPWAMEEKDFSLYELTMESEKGWTQYLSAVFKESFKPDAKFQFYEAGFSPRTDNLAPYDEALMPNNFLKCWLDDFLDLRLQINPVL